MYVTKMDSEGHFKRYVNGNFDIVKTVRLDKESLSIIELMPGRNFSQKLRNLIMEYMSLKLKAEKT